ncbi:MAG: RNA methyltransferase [Campylobacterota bacterium]|nr:RNA methyltransferase [Campylobacterota bacterium]
MNFTSIDDLDSPSLTIYRQLRDNAFSEDNSFIADSPKVVNMLLETSIEVKSILATQEYYEKFKDLIAQKEIPHLFVTEKKVMESIVGHRVHHNVMMHGIRPAQTALNDLGDNIIMLDEISSTENIGSIARSAAALGVDSYLLPEQGPHPYGRRSLRVSMGYVSKLKTHLYNDIFSTFKALKADGYKIFAAEVTKESIPLMDIIIPKKWVVLMGHEGKGLSPEIIAACDASVQIEMAPAVKSFNVGVAASILMYQFKNKTLK